MSEVLSNETPDTSLEVPATAGPAPADVEAVVEGSAGEAPAVVDAKRFNGLMSAHQSALDALKVERDARLALEARLQEEKPVVTEPSGSDEVALLRQELAAQRLETSKAQALAKYPEAAGFADLIVGSSASEVEGVAAAIAQRVKADREANGVVAPAATDTIIPEPVVTEPVVVPVLAGGSAAPGEPSRSEELQTALKQGDWNGFWAAKTTVKEATNLA